MFRLSRPSDDEMNDQIERLASLPFTYREVGASYDAGEPAGYAVAHHRVKLGEGIDCFRIACQALCDWRMFPDYLQRIPRLPAIEADQPLALRMRVGSLWVEMFCRIIYTIDIVLPMGGLRFGFGYGTLPGHVERGEERFLVEQLADDTVWYDLYAFSRPQTFLSWLGLPVARYFQRRFAVDSCRGMFECCQEAAVSP